MKIEIYGIDEDTFKCAGCEMAKRILKEAKLEYEFKRIVKLVDGYPQIDQNLYEELQTKIPVKKLLMPYIFIDSERVMVRDLSSYLKDKGYDVD
ncbi:hypothetical protein ACX818_001342 [Acinetobacter baumannii]